MFVSIVGVVLADVLMFVQLGIMNTQYEAAVSIHTKVTADAVIISKQAKQLATLFSFPRRRLYQAFDVPGVCDVEPMYVGSVEWKHPQTRKKSQMMIVGINPASPYLKIDGLEKFKGALQLPDHVVFDSGSRGNYTTTKELISQGKGVTTEIARRTVTLCGMCNIGASFQIDGVLITGIDNYLRLFPRQEAGAVNIGLIKIGSDRPADQVISMLKERLPDDVQVLSKANFIKFEIDNMNRTAPLAFVFGTLTAIAFVVGAAIVYQILSADVNDHLAEYATFKAMGFGENYFLGVIFEEALIVAICGFIPGSILANTIYWIIRSVATIPIQMPLSRLLLILVLTLAMCCISGALAASKLRLADPAEIF
ncbi:MAG: ABC transporter permease DevC [Candidatus Obscuribacterales bacterium]|nr:ABC transporter permease DevC [Candidatus Obscuribacterales bacterium]